MKQMTIKDVARSAKVSIGTVSRILNETGFGYSEETYQRVKRIADRSGYIPNMPAQSLVTKRTHLIALVVPDLHAFYFPELAEGIERAADEGNYSVLLFSFCGGREARVMRQLQEKSVDGAILFDETPRGLFDCLLNDIRFPCIPVRLAEGASCQISSQMLKIPVPTGNRPYFEAGDIAMRLLMQAMKIPVSSNREGWFMPIYLSV